MGTASTARSKIAYVRDVLRTASERGQKLSRKKVEAQIALKGCTSRTARELIQRFIDAEEIIEVKGELETVLFPNPDIYKAEMKDEITEIFNTSINQADLNINSPLEKHD